MALDRYGRGGREFPGGRTHYSQGFPLPEEQVWVMMEVLLTRCPSGGMARETKRQSIGEAISRVQPGSRIMVGGFGLAGYPEGLVEALAASGIRDLTIISNDLGSPGVGLGKLLTNGQIKALIGNYYNWNPEVAKAYSEGNIQVTLVPQGTFAEAIRAAGVGIPAFYTATGVGTELATGKELKEFNGRTYVLEQAIDADVALIKAHKADELGNLTYYKTARNFNPLMAMAATLTIAEVDEIVPSGALDPEGIVTPHMFVHIITRGERG
jgi:3-oxoacid CoA-transferase A subunit